MNEPLLQERTRTLSEFVKSNGGENDVFGIFESTIARPKINLETLSKTNVTCLFVSLYSALIISCCLCILEVTLLQNVALGEHICKNNTIYDPIIYDRKFKAVNTWYSIRLLAKNVSVDSGYGVFSYKLQLKTMFENSNKLTVIENINVARNQSFTGCQLNNDNHEHCVEELILETNTKGWTQECPLSTICTSKIMFTIIDAPFCAFGLSSSFSKLPLSAFNFYVSSFCSVITVAIWIYLLRVFKCNRWQYNDNDVREGSEGCSEKQASIMHERQWLIYVLPAVLLLQYPDDITFLAYQSSSKADFFGEKVNAILRPFGLSCVLIFWLCVIDVGSQQLLLDRKNGNGLGFYFYFPKIFLCFTIWGLVTVYEFRHNVPDMNKYFIMQYVEGNYYVSSFCGVFLLLSYLLLVTCSCHRTRKTLSEVPYHMVRKEQMVFSFIALCSFALIFYVPTVLFVTLKPVSTHNIWKLLQRMLFGYPTVFLISVNIYLIIYIYMPPGLAGVKRKWITKELKGLSRRRSKFMFDDKSNLVVETATSRRVVSKLDERLLNLEDSTKGIRSSKLKIHPNDTTMIQPRVMTFSSFCLETALELIEASYLAYHDVYVGNNLPGGGEETERRVDCTSSSNSVRITDGSHGLYGKNERKRLHATKYNICGSAFDEVTTCYAIVFIRKDRLVVSFRGTSSATHWKSNCKCFNPQPIDWLDVNDILNKQGLDFFFAPHVHSGFKEMYLSVRLKLINIIEEAIQKDKRNENLLKNIFLTGHSLGGALATLASLDISQLFYKYNIVVYNFGSPRVGDHSFAALMSAVVPNTFRVVSEGTLLHIFNNSIHVKIF